MEYKVVKKYENGQLVEEKWYKNGVLNNEENMPSIIRYKDGVIVEKQYYHFGILYFLEKIE